MKDIANVLNISIATVSRALREMPEIHEDTRRSVMRVAEELDYQPNQLAKNLVKKPHPNDWNHRAKPELLFFFGVAQQH